MFEFLGQVRVRIENVTSSEGSHARLVEVGHRNVERKLLGDLALPADLVVNLIAQTAVIPCAFEAAGIPEIEIEAVLPRDEQVGLDCRVFAQNVARAESQILAGDQ